jgi:hypothetical protein
VGFRLKVDEKRDIKYHHFCEKFSSKFSRINGEFKEICGFEWEDFRQGLMGEYRKAVKLLEK